MEGGGAAAVEPGPGVRLRVRRADAGAGPRRAGKPRGLLVGEAQAIAQPLGVFLDLHRQGGEPQHRIWREAKGGLDAGEAGQQVGPRRAAQHGREEAVVLHQLRDLGPARRRQEAQQLHPNPLGGENREPGALAHAGR